MTPSDAKTRPRHLIGGYRVIAPIGAGGFATVYRALDENTKSEVAIKVLAENHSLVPDTRRRFVDEVGLLATIDSPSIAKIYELGETDTGQPYMVLELADRGDLRRRLEEIRRSHEVLSRSDLTMLAHHLYDSLTTLHEAEIVHRDVSPGNILIRSRRAPGRRVPTGEGGVTLLEPGERFLLADLGHAKDLFLASGFTAGGGTRGYASPEQIDDITVVDHRADIFSATAVIEWAAHDGRYAKDLEPFFDKGLAEDPGERFDDMAEWHASFCSALGANGLSRGNQLFGGGLPPAARSLIARLNNRTTMVAVLAAAVVGLLALANVSRLGDDTEIAEGNLTRAVKSSNESVDESPSTTEGDTELLLVETDGNDDQDPPPSMLPDDEADAPSTTVEPEQGATTETTVTTSPSEGSTTTLDPNFVGLPLAEITSPVERAEVDGDLLVEGRATFPGGLRHVEVVVRNLETNLNWNPFTGEFEENWLRFAVRLSGEDESDATWRFTLPGDQTEPGSYMIRAWARGVNGEGDPRGFVVTVVIN